MLAVSLSWIALYTFTPASDRPYVDGSTDNSAAAMVFGYNGLERFGISIPGAVTSGPGVSSGRGGAGGPQPAATGPVLAPGGPAGGKHRGWETPAGPAPGAWPEAVRQREHRAFFYQLNFPGCGVPAAGTGNSRPRPGGIGTGSTGTGGGTGRYWRPGRSPADRGQQLRARLDQAAG